MYREDVRSEKMRRIRGLTRRLEHHEAEYERHEEAGCDVNARAHREALMSCRRKLIRLGVLASEVGC